MSIGEALALREAVNTAIADVDDGKWTVHGLDAAEAVLLAHNGHYRYTVYEGRHHIRSEEPETGPVPEVVAITQAVMSRLQP